ncbi:toxin secretion ABC transporter ATP-binding protein [Crocosphaera subtropica ATCC 51142]|uniref:Toxin secretion ABC transporter ATP-binding protein n=1 Tax=Crocosphaera subtropica (strain ATCC 51142 / BH68) TaxID=43989 RepID=B1WPH3_CROS5|nr:peptidase domain-containing ABC transporter [Crocosphaera subtropica]ACB51543.1 toxin secretion ABC transporter ATP-binding protein [Crocosphaera subtropica ATCC 51142]
MIPTQITTQDFLAATFPFNQLPQAARVELSTRLQVQFYPMGTPILTRNQIPQQIAILYQGQARLLGQDPRTGQEMTLELLKPGALIGWISNLRHLGCETVLAREDTVCFTIAVDEFRQFVQAHILLQEGLWQQRCALVEGFDVLGRQLQTQALADVDLKELAQKAVTKAQIRYLLPGKLSNHQLDRDRLWLISSAGTVNNLSVGHLIYANQSYLEVKGQAVRLIGLPLLDFKVLIFQGKPTTQDSIPETPTQERQQLERLIQQTPSLDSKPQNLIPTPPHFPYRHIRGVGDIEAPLACFAMIAKHWGMSFRRSTVHRVLSDQYQRTGSLSLPLCSAVAELMGLNTQIVQVPTNAIARLPVPALIPWQESFAVLFESSGKGVVLGIPERGIKSYQLPQFLDLWGEMGQALLLQKNEITPQQKFGFRWFLPSLIRYRKVLFEVLLASFFIQLFGLVNPFVVQRIIDLAINQKSLETLPIFGILMLVIAVFESILSSLRTYLFNDATNRLDLSLGSQIIDHLLRLPLRFFEKRPVGELAHRMGELENIRAFLTGTALTVIIDTIFSLLYILVMAIYSWQLTLVALMTVPVFMILTLMVSPIVRRQLRTKAEKSSHTQSYLVEVLSGIQTVKAQNIETRSRWQWQKRYGRYVKSGFKTSTTAALAGSASNFLNKLSQLLVLWMGAYLVVEGHLTLGELIAFRIIAGYVTSPLMRLAQTWQKFQETALSLERLSDIMDTPQEQEEDQQGNLPMPTVKGTITYENVAFSFKSGGTLQLNHVNVTIPSGKFVAIVGQSGSGKSTLTKLLVRLYQPNQGRILLDGYDISKVELYSLRRQIGVVPQDSLLFDGTIEENIALTYPDASSEEIIEAATIAGAHDFIMDLPNGYNTRVGERGSSLSGGQRQRIAIARTVLQQPNLLIMDEATSALDYRTEQTVCHNLAQAFQNRTVLFITHRLNTIQHADLILMMDAGSVAEMGTHEELMNLKGRYYCLYQQQETQL